MATPTGSAGESVGRRRHIWRVRHARAAARLPPRKGPQSSGWRTRDGTSGDGAHADVVRLEGASRRARAGGARVEESTVVAGQMKRGESRAPRWSPSRMEMARAQTASASPEGKDSPSSHEQCAAPPQGVRAPPSRGLGATPNAGHDSGGTDYLATRRHAGRRECAARVRGAAAAGASQLLLAGFVRDTQGFIERWGREVAPRVAEGGRP